MKVIPNSKNRPVYLTQKEQSKGLRNATSAFESDVNKDSFSYKDYNYSRSSADERVPDTVAITDKVKSNPQDYEVEYYDNGNYKEIRTSDKEYLKTKRKMLNGKTKKRYATYNQTTYKFNSDGSIKQEIVQGIYRHNTKTGRKYSVYNDEITDYDYKTGQVSKRDFRRKNKAKADRLDYKTPAPSEDEFMTIRNNKVVIVNKKGTVLRTTIKPSEIKTSNELIKNYNKSLREQGRDQKKARNIISKVNAGTATNKDYVGLLNINTKYGTNLDNVRQAINVGETNKQLLNIKPPKTFYSPEQNFIDNNPNLEVAKQFQVKRIYNDKNQIVGIEGFGQSRASPAGAFFKESDVRKAELTATAGLRLAEKREQDNLPERSPAGKLLDNAGGFIDTSLGKVGINLTEEKEDFSKGFNIMKSQVKSDYKSVKDFANKNFALINTTQEKGVSIGPVIESTIANNFLLGVEGGEVKPLYQVLEKKREKTLELGTAQANKMVESFTAEYKPLKVAGLTLLNERQVQSTTIGANVAGELGLGVVDMALLLGSKATRYPVTTTSLVVAGVGAYSIAPTITAGAFVGLNAYDWVSRPTAEEKFLAVGGDLGLSMIAVGGPKIIEAGVTKLNPKYAKVEVDAIGRKVIKGVDVGDDTRKIDIELVPAGKRGLNAQVNPKMLLEEYGDAIPFSKSPNIPKTTKFQQDFLDILKEDEIKFATDSSVGGSFAQKALLKKSRPFGDLDIVTDDPLLIAMKTKEKFGDMVAIKKQTITDSPLGTFDIYKVAQRQSDGSLIHIADIDPIRFAEEGLASKYGTVEIDGLPITDIRSRFIAKVQQASRGKRTAKVLEDIKILSDGQLTMNSQSMRGAFGWSFAEQAVFIDTTGDVISAQRGLFKNQMFNNYKQDILVNKPNFDGSDSLEASFFASPPDITSGNPQLRASRLGLYSDSRASFEDVLSGNVQIGKGKPQAVLFPDAKIADIPDNLKGIFAKAKAGDKTAEADFLKQYKEYQMKPTGEFKPFGYGGGEAELTLSPQEIISGEGQAGVTLINNQRVSIIKAKVKQASPELAELQIKATKGALTNEETIKFNTLLDEESGILSTKNVKPIIAKEDIFSSSSAVREIKTNSPILMKDKVYSQESHVPSQNILLSNNYSSKAVKFQSSPIRNSNPSIRINSPIGNSNSINYSDSAIDYSSASSLGVSNPSISIQSPPPYSPSSSIGDSPYIPSELIKNTPASSGFGKLSKGKSKQGGGFDVFVKTRGVWTQQNKQPIRNIADAESFGRFVVSTTPQASFQTKKSKSKAQPMSFNKVTTPNSFYKKGDTFIEKNKFRINTQGELSGITFKGLQAQSFKGRRNIPKKKSVWRLK